MSQNRRNYMSSMKILVLSEIHGVAGNVHISPPLSLLSTIHPGARVRPGVPARVRAYARGVGEWGKGEALDAGCM